MTCEKLREIIQGQNKLTVSEVQEIIYELKNDCADMSYRKVDDESAYYYSGEMNAFNICMDLLDKCEEKE